MFYASDISNEYPTVRVEVRKGKRKRQKSISSFSFVNCECLNVYLIKSLNMKPLHGTIFSISLLLTARSPFVCTINIDKVTAHLFTKQCSYLFKFPGASENYFIKLKYFATYGWIFS